MAIVASAAISARNSTSLGARRIMPQQAAGRGRRRDVVMQILRLIFQFWQRGPQRFQRYSTWPKQLRRIAGEIDDGRFQADCGRTPVQHHINASTEIIKHVQRAGWAGPREGVGAGRGDGHAGRFNQSQRDRMIGHAHGDRIQFGSQRVGNGVLFLQHDGQWTGRNTAETVQARCPERHEPPVKADQTRRCAQSADHWRDAPWPGKSCLPRQHPARWRPNHRPSRWGTRPIHRCG